jgi:hypothetical protein
VFDRLPGLGGKERIPGRREKKESLLTNFYIDEQKSGDLLWKFWTGPPAPLYADLSDRAAFGEVIVGADEPPCHASRRPSLDGTSCVGLAALAKLLPLERLGGVPGHAVDVAALAPGVDRRRWTYPHMGRNRRGLTRRPWRWWSGWRGKTAAGVICGSWGSVAASGYACPRPRCGGSCAATVWDREPTDGFRRGRTGRTIGTPGARWSLTRRQHVRPQAAGTGWVVARARRRTGDIAVVPRDQGG